MSLCNHTYEMKMIKPAFNSDVVEELADIEEVDDVDDIDDKIDSLDIEA